MLWSEAYLQASKINDEHLVLPINYQIQKKILKLDKWHWYSCHRQPVKRENNPEISCSMGGKSFFYNLYVLFIWIRRHI